MRSAAREAGEKFAYANLSPASRGPLQRLVKRRLDHWAKRVACERLEELLRSQALLHIGVCSFD